MKKIISAAVLAALSMAAHADVDIYGKVRMGLEHGKAAGQTALVNGELKAASQVEDWGSYIGFKGNEQLGNGLKAVWQIEQNVDLTEGSGFTNRETFVGLENKMGSVKLGRLNNFTKSDMGVVDPWEYGTGVNGLRSFTRFDGQVDNAVRVDAEVIPGLKVGALYGFDKTRDATGSDRANNTTTNVGATYDFGAGWVGYSYLTQKGSNDTTVTSKVHRVEVGTEVAGVQLAAGYQQAKNGLSDDGIDTVNGGYFPAVSSIANAIMPAGIIPSNSNQAKTKEFVVTASTTYGAWTPKLSLAYGKDINVDGIKVDDTGYNQFVIGTDYAFSKKTKGQVAYGRVHTDAGLAGTKNESTLSVGLVHNF